MRRYWFLILLMILSSSVLAKPVRVLPTLPLMQKIGAVQYRYWFWKVYDIQLYAKQKPWSNQQPFALKIDYLRDFTKQQIVDETMKQIRRQTHNYSSHALQQWRQQMLDIFPNVRSGSILVGYFD